MPLPEHLAAGLDQGWVLLPDAIIGADPPVAIGIVLLHPLYGVALLEVAPQWTADAPARLRRRLEVARFGAIFPGHLPVVHHRLRPEELPALPEVLAAAFAAQPPLDLPGGDAWTLMVQRALRGQPVPRPRRRLVPLAAGAALLAALVALAWTTGGPQGLPPGAGAVEAGADPAAHAMAAVSAGLLPAALAASPPPGWPDTVAPASPAGDQASPASPPARPLADPAMLGAMLRRGEALLAIGDVSAARLFFERAAAAGSAAGAEAMGRTYDPAVLATLGARGIRPDAALAATWYRRARELGASAATENTR